MLGHIFVVWLSIDTTLLLLAAGMAGDVNLFLNDADSKTVAEIEVQSSN